LANKTVKKVVSLFLSLAGIAILTSALSAQAADWEGQYHRGDLSVELGLGFGSHGMGFGYGTALVPGVEWIAADWKLGAAVPLALGVAVKGTVEYIPATGLGFGADALAAIHLGFKGLDASEFVQNLDVYTAFGAGAVYVGDASVPFGLVFPAVYTGVAWYFRENRAVYIEGLYRNGWKAVGYGGATVGLFLKKPPA
jgi:hypothetical protein